jgi:membrane-associated protein
MENLPHFLDYIVNMNEHLAALVSQVGPWIYVILFLIIFAETGFVIMPFLPGDSLLFVVGSLAAVSSMDVHLVVILLIIAGIVGNTVNYSIGRWFGNKIFSRPDSKFFSQEKLNKAHAFYEKYGGISVVVSRFLPIVRTFVPFVAGMAEMTYTRFTFFNIVGAVAWVCFFVYGGYFFGHTQFVQDHFGYFIIGIVVITLIPLFFQLLRNFVSK